MKIKLKPRILKMPIEDMLKSALKDAKDPRSRIFFAIAYFQYINKLSVNKAIILFKQYILTDEQKTTYPLSVYLSKNGTLVTKYIEIPIKIDDFLAQYIPEIKNHKDLVSKIVKNTYLQFIKRHLKINASDITAYVLYKMIEDIGIYNFISFKEHWALFSRRLIPYLLKNKI